MLVQVLGAVVSDRVTTTDREGVGPEPQQRPPVEIGWIVAGPMDAVDLAATHKALTSVNALLADGLPDFQWRASLVHRREVVLDRPADPMALVDLGVLERDSAHWDFAFVVTELPLSSERKPFMLGAPAQALDVAVLSTARLDPEAMLDEPSRLDRTRTLVQRITALVMHLFGHLNDLPHSDDPLDFMHVPADERALDVPHRLAGWERLRLRLSQVADPRIEERERSATRIGFFVRAAWENRSEIQSGVKRIAPWQFPLRYSRLTTAAMSTQLILIITAEAWELGMSQPGARVAWLSAGALLTTSYYLLHRQHLLSRLGTRLTEQNVVTAVAVGVGVLLGMATTYALLFASTWLAAQSLFAHELVRNWTGSIPWVTTSHYFALSGFVASVGLLMGALGASFEEESYFRRVAMLDEET